MIREAKRFVNKEVIKLLTVVGLSVAWICAVYIVSQEDNDMVQLPSTGVVQVVPSYGTLEAIAEKSEHAVVDTMVHPIVCLSLEEPIAEEEALEDEGVRYVETVGNYFDVYNKPTADTLGSRSIDMNEIYASQGRSKHTWVSFEGFSKSIPNHNCLTTASGYMVEEDIDVANQMYRGRYMAGLGPAMMIDGYKGQYITASDMKYGTYFDVVLRDRESGDLVYLPCVLAECKAHTYPNGYIQTGVAKLGDGSLEDLSSTLGTDYSSVEFTTCNKGADGTNRGSALCTAFEIEEIIIYTLEASGITSSEE